MQGYVNFVHLVQLQAYSSIHRIHTSLCEESRVVNTATNREVCHSRVGISSSFHLTFLLVSFALRNLFILYIHISILLVRSILIRDSFETRESKLN